MSNESRVPPEHADWDALARYFAGESPTEEAARVRQWLAEHPAEAAALAATDDAVRRSRPVAPVDVDAAWRRMSTRLDERPAAKEYPFASRPPSWLRAAAAVLLLAGVVTVWRLIPRSETAAESVASREFRTEAGRRDSIVLSDGTGVLLGPASSLQVGDGYGTDRREVRLVGEALFDVRHDDARPFVVHAPGVMIQDLGTTFTVRTTNGASDLTTVAVTSGSVRVGRPSAPADSGVVLREGQVGTVRPTGPIAVLEGDAVQTAVAWTRGQLVFRDAPLTEVVATLRRWYGVDIRIADTSLNRRTFSGSYDGEPLATVLNAISLGIPARVERTDSVVIIGGSSRR